jgi:hypothetical protein
LTQSVQVSRFEVLGKVSEKVILLTKTKVKGAKRCVEVVLDGPAALSELVDGVETFPPYKLIAVGYGRRPHPHLYFEYGESEDEGNENEQKNKFVIMLVKEFGDYYERRGIGIVDARLWLSDELKGEMEWILLK